MKTTAVLLPSRHQSNIYERRQLISQKLTNLVMFRINSETIDCTSDDIKFCDILLQSENHKFIALIKMIDLEEKDIYQFGAPYFNPVSSHSI